MLPDWSVDFETINGCDIALITNPRDPYEFGIFVLLDSGVAWWTRDGKPTDDRPPWAEEAERQVHRMAEPKGLVITFQSAGELLES